MSSHHRCCCGGAAPLICQNLVVDGVSMGAGTVDGTFLSRSSPGQDPPFRETVGNMNYSVNAPGSQFNGMRNNNTPGTPFFEAEQNADALAPGFTGSATGSVIHGSDSGIVAASARMQLRCGGEPRLRLFLSMNVGGAGAFTSSVTAEVSSGGVVTLPADWSGDVTVQFGPNPIASFNLIKEVFFPSSTELARRETFIGQLSMTDLAVAA